MELPAISDSGLKNFFSAQEEKFHKKLRKEQLKNQN